MRTPAGGFTRSAAFALIWALSVHDKTAPDTDFIATFPLMQAAAIAFAQSLAPSADKPTRWIGTHAGRELQFPAEQVRISP